jgi:putative membrane protein
MYGPALRASIAPLQRRARLAAVLRGALISLVTIAIAFAVTNKLLAGMSVSGGVGSYLWIALLFGVVNAFLGTIIRIVTLPVVLLTFGLFAIVINAAVLEITAALTSHLKIDSFFWTAIWAAIILSICTVVLDLTVGRAARHA